LTVEVTVVEFNVSEVVVQQGTYTIGSGSGDTTASPTAFTEANTFPYHTWQADSTSTLYSDHNIRIRVDGDGGADSLSFSRHGTGTVVIDGHWYTAEAVGGTPAFTVQESDMALVSVSTLDDDTLTPVDLTKSFLVGSYKSSSTTSANDDGTVDAALTADDTVTVQRTSASGRIDGTWYTVEFDSAGDESVYRNTISAQAATSPDTDSPTSGTWVSANSMAHVAGATGSFVTGSFPGEDGADCPDAHCALTITGTAEVTVEHSTAGGEADNDISWEVIEWDVEGGPAARRVMVR
jgi:hypothetical protein